MSQDKEHEIKLQFLEEAKEYLNTIESSILGLSAATRIDSKKIDSLLRAAHSIKGGAAMMEYQTLSHLAHRLEDFFKVLKTQKVVNAAIEKLLLIAVDCLRQVVDFNHQNAVIDQQWMQTHAEQIFEQLQQQLGEPEIEDTSADLSPEAGDENMVVMIFETEVEDYLQRLEVALANPQKSDLEEIKVMAQELGDLGEMLQLAAFKSLCDSITQYLEASPEHWAEIAQLALQAWRRSHSAIMAGEMHNLPTRIDFGDQTNLTVADEISVVSETDELDSVDSAVDDEISIIFDLLDEPVDSVDSVADNASITPTATTELLELNSELTPLNTVQETQENTVRVPLKQLEQLNDLFGELTIERNGINLYLERLRNSVRVLERRVRAVQQSHTRMQAAYEKQDFFVEHSSATAPNNLHPRSQEAMQNILQLREVTDDLDLILKDADQTASELNWTAKQLQTCITQLRMRPLSDLLGRFPRALRELSLEYGKQVELKIFGDNTLIERSILEALSDPLMHLLRNAFDHGIETPQTRRAAGKPEQGVIEIKAAYRGNQTIITFSDDGGGIDLDKIQVQARQLGLDPVAIAHASDAELLTLIFEPGFSTADEVTALSGRGVGMDVVRTNLRHIRGDIKVDTQQGLGTTFTISVPFTLSVARVLLVESKGMLLAFPNHAIAEMVLLNSEQVLTIAGKEVLSWKRQMVPLIRLSDWLKFRTPKFTTNSEAAPIMNAPTVLLIAQGDEWAGIQVDRCWGEQEVAIRPIEGSTLSGGNRVGAIAMPPGFSGCTILGDGRVVPLVNALELLRWIASCQQSSSIEQEDTQFSSTSPLINQKHTILVVDDSLNVRRFLSLSLEKAGYRVEQAKDGQDALEKLLNGLRCQAVICDIDMPHLDGYGFLSQIKSNPTFRQLPIMMLTSRSGDQERQLAMDLGATAFFSKPYIKQDLLQTLEQVIHSV